MITILPIDQLPAGVQFRMHDIDDLPAVVARMEAIHIGCAVFVDKKNKLIFVPIDDTALPNPAQVRAIINGLERIHD